MGNKKARYYPGFGIMAVNVQFIAIPRAGLLNVNLLAGEDGIQNPSGVPGSIQYFT